MRPLSSWSVYEKASSVRISKVSTLSDQEEHLPYHTPTANTYATYLFCSCSRSLRRWLVVHLHDIPVVFTRGDTLRKVVLYINPFPRFSPDSAVERTHLIILMVIIVQSLRFLNSTFAVRLGEIIWQKCTCSGRSPGFSMRTS